MMKKLFIIFFLPVCIFAQVDFPILNNYANDYTNTLRRSELNNLNHSLKTFDDTTSNQLVFLMIRTLDGYPLETYTYEVAAKNKIGSAKKNNGVLFFVAKDDRKMRIEVGYGLEGALPDALASSILRNEVRPYFKKDDYYAGVAAGLDAIIKATAGEYKNEEKDDGDVIKFPIIYIIIILIIISIFGKRGGKGGGSGSILPWLIISSMGSKRHGGSWGSGGGFGGGFGGFSGGGGSFGGGGASGSW